MTDEDSKHDWILAVGYTMLTREEILLVRKQSKRLQAMRTAIRQSSVSVSILSGAGVLGNTALLISGILSPAQTIASAFVTGVLTTLCATAVTLWRVTRD